MELTKSGSVKNFKTDFCKMKTKDCRSMLERHKLDYARLWMTKTPEAYYSWQVESIYDSNFAHEF
jgi:hypothetical protein